MFAQHDLVRRVSCPLALAPLRSGGMGEQVTNYPVSVVVTGGEGRPHTPGRLPLARSGRNRPKQCLEINSRHQHPVPNPDHANSRGQPAGRSRRIGSAPADPEQAGSLLDGEGVTLFHGHAP